MIYLEVVFIAMTVGCGLTVAYFLYVATKSQ